jgi:hypothetical protein
MAAVEVLEQENVVGQVGHAEFAESCYVEQVGRLEGSHEADSGAGEALNEGVTELSSSRWIGDGSHEIVQTIDYDPTRTRLVDGVQERIDEFVDVEIDG